MKKIISIVCIICIAAIFSACHKEGVYNPSKKISKITCHTSELNENGDEIGLISFNQKWTWNVNGTLKEIVMDIGQTYQFKYDKNKRLVRVDILNKSLGQSYHEYIYEGKYLKQARLYFNMSDNSEQTQIYNFTHSGGKITEVDYEINNLKHNAVSETTVGMFSPLQCVLPGEVVQLMEKEQKELAKKCASKGTFMIKTHYKFTWSGGNVTRIESEIKESYGNSPTDGDDSFNEDVTHTTMDLAYDKKHNPFRDFLLGDPYDMTLSHTGCFANKNNVVKLETISDRTDGPQAYTVEFAYTYKNGYPVTKSEVNGLYSETYEYK